MNLSKESFPDDDLIDSIYPEEIKFSTFLNSNSTYGEHSSLSAAGQSSSSGGHENYEKRPILRRQNGRIDSHQMKEKITKRSQSCQDLHTEYTRKRYQHVKSKVKQYIAELKAQEQRQKIIRHQSMPETLGNLSEETEFDEKITQSGDSNNNNSSSGDDLVEKMNAKDQYIMELQSINSTLHQNLQEKVALVARLKRKSDTMQVELSHLQEKAKRPVNGYAILRNTPKRPQEPRRASITMATQTDASLNACGFQDVELEFETESDDNSSEVNQSIIEEDCNLRRRTNSNSYKFSKINASEDNGDSGNSGCCDLEESNAVGVSFGGDNRGAWAPIKRKKRFKKASKSGKKNFWKYLIGLGGCCSKSKICNDRFDNYSYDRIPMSETFLTPQTSTLYISSSQG